MARALCDGGFDLRRINVEGRRINVNEDGLESGAACDFGHDPEGESRKMISLASGKASARRM
jgi:hypothetical protein